ncbi:polysaccharide pyruvyl transferase family protein [Terricaulis silvestris]|uniref:Polysaccharide pyruvyl transferase CsaB n=1 Tax=Terricaulis silvestris TaxID=2686094 RepID=A0A6I6MLG8_9CAUL|nr:polysaccharide pyruvyl transferase family protein [Terricaulis silvestris]QGZ94046.1 polysaccharide pyruvyl transferase CsaB [Terricaulis silvestris]
MTIPEVSIALGAAPTHRAMPLRIALIGGFGIGNFGNDASLEAVTAFLRAERPDAELSCICTTPSKTTFAGPVFAAALRPKGVWRWLDMALLRLPSLTVNWFYSLWVLRRFDVILFPGTGVFDDFSDTPLGWPSRLLRWSLAARLRGVRLVFLSVGAGPIVNPVSRFLMKSAAKLAHHRSYRDTDSRTFMQSIGVDEAASSVLPDVAFLLPSPPSPPRAAGGKVTIGVGVMKYSGWRKDDKIYENYVATQARLIRWLEEQGHGVEILVGQTNDWHAVHDIGERLGRSLVDASRQHMGSLHDVMLACASTDVVVASRYHVQIAALQLGRPVISLSYAPKNDALLEQAGLQGFSQDINQVDFELLTRQLEILTREHEHYAAIVAERVSAMRKRLRDALAELDLLGDE